MTLTKDEITKWRAHLIFDSKDALKTAKELYASKRYHHALFFGHLAVEKQIKAIFLSKHRSFSPPVHDLIYLAKKTFIPINKELLNDLNEINTFNIRTRYEDYKRIFYKKATKEYCEKWLNKVRSFMDYINKYEQFH